MWGNASLYLWKRKKYRGQKKYSTRILYHASIFFMSVLEHKSMWFTPGKDRLLGKYAVYRNSISVDRRKKFFDMQ